MNLGLIVRRYHRQLFFGSWFLLNIIQSYLTGLLDDEAYYWVYSKFLDWGYFDHPPMIALLIKIGYSILHNEVGVRLMMVILSTGTLWLIEKLINIKDPKLFYGISLSMGVLQLGGIIAVPDVPLLFFTALFFLSYKKLVNQPGIVSAILAGCCIALLFYSKYHGALVVLFAFFANPVLFKKYTTWLAGLVALILFAPHLLWQYQHGFPSLQYHLFERNASVYHYYFTTDYLLEQFLLAGPLAGFILIWATVRKKAADPTERALKVTTLGFYIFFLIATLKGSVEGNWTFPAFVGLIVLGHQYLLDKEKLSRWIYRLSAVTILMVLVARLYLIGIFPPIGIKDDEFLFNREWTGEVQKQAKGRSVFFIDSYQRASKYWFYSGTPAFSLNTLDYRRNNFNLWKMEDTLQDKRMYAVTQGIRKAYYTDTFETQKGVFQARAIDDYFSFSRVMIKTPAINAKRGDILNLSLTIETDRETLQRMHPKFDSVHLWMAIYWHEKFEPYLVPTDLTLGNIRTGKEKLNAKLILPVQEGKYTIRFGFTSCIAIWPTVNSSVIKLSVN